MVPSIGERFLRSADCKRVWGKPDLNTIRYPREVPLTPVFKELGLTRLLSVERKTEGYEIFGQCPTVKQAHVSRARRKKCKVCLHDFDFWFWFEL
jgi:hypothetical protein